ncbi:transcriptional regulator of RNA polII, SAGA, subunit-domain-containing protein [Collybia nuda]|uniref:Transcriptional regulator of RNA polII, SAGA, subunit-domain-containing protein n=1 Tax=Collybia nuda TaxID=64659 RepID=A0A9P6CEG8_9AGAR|nr:transcriptional regulator of RNA polII, SAGA, subunit-domain-containing protein [Collybia nuda]
MSLSSTSTIKQQLSVLLGSTKAHPYFDALTSFVSGRSSRTEFDDAIRQLLDGPTLVQLHNALVISLFDATTSHKPPPTPPPAAPPKPAPRKRRRIELPFQGDPNESRSLRSARLKRWTLAVGRRERDRIHALHADPPRPLTVPRDEIASEPAVVLLSERGDPPGSRLPVHLYSVTRAPTAQHIADRMNLICAQNNLGPPSRNVPALMNLACEAKLKQLITHALTLTSASNAISSIAPARDPNRPPPVLDTAAFHTLFTLSPADLPNKSATAMRLALGETDLVDDDDHDIVLLKDREVRDQRWQIVALLGERSTVRDSLRGIR